MGSYGIDDGQFLYPYGVAVDSSGNVYVADTNNHRIQKFKSSTSTSTPTPTLVDTYLPPGATPADKESRTDKSDG